jgi:maltooligosyltrehalose trehalohydrolase
MCLVHVTDTERELAGCWAGLGASCLDSGLVRFRVWAPQAEEVAVQLDGELLPLAPLSEGVFTLEARVAAGSDYRFVLDGQLALPDPASRSQPDGVGGRSRILDPRRFRWRARDWPGLSLEELVVYELHVGAFSEDGSFDGVAARLDYLRELGVTAIELMPVATFPGERNWGYDGVYSSAPHAVYGGPERLAALVDAAHQAGLGVILDVVYNHIGPGSEAITAFAPYFTDRATTDWGDALDYSARGVREWAIQNAEMWVRDYHVDGLRLDATHAIIDEGNPHVLAELATRVRALNPRVLVISEITTGDLRPIEQWGHDAQWADEFHHLLHVLLTGEQEGYYGEYRASVAALARQYERTPAPRLVFCSQNHDQLGNRALGDRPATHELALRAAALLLAPQTPLLFMGEEYGERHPFQFFTDHRDPEIAGATREGRRREFGQFSDFAGARVPDPQALTTFTRSRLDPGAGDPELLALYRLLLARRRSRQKALAARAEEESRTLSLRTAALEAQLNFSAQRRHGLPPWGIALEHLA